MAMQDALGPVFSYEWLRVSRRWQMYAIRSGFVGSILAALLSLWASEARWGEELDLRRMAAFGASVYTTIMTVELTLILLAAPAATAGSVCLDRSRGTLLHVMSTELTDFEIVLGKLAAGILPIAGLVFCVLPVLMLASLLGGADPAALFGSSAVALGTAILACTLAFTLSVRGRKTHEVLSATYLLLFAWVAIPPGALPFAQAAGLRSGGWVEGALEALLWTNPYWLAAPSYNEPASTHLRRVSLFASGCLGLSALLAAAAARRIRSASINQDADRERRDGLLGRLRIPALLPSPSLDANPVLWREWCRMRPSRWARWTWRAYGAIALLTTGLSLSDAIHGGGEELVVVANLYLVGVALLLLSVRSAMSLSEERVRGSLDVLLSTPMTTTEILAGKWWGTFRLVPYLIILPGLLGAACCWESGLWRNYVAFIGLIAGYGAAITSLGLALSVWIARQGRVLALSVGIFVAMCIGWMVVVLVASPSSDASAAGLAMGSPLYGTVVGTIGVLELRGGPDALQEAISAWLVIWSVAYWTLAAGLFLGAWLAFDRRLGRMSPRGSRTASEDGLWSLIPRFGRDSVGQVAEGATEPA